MNKKPMPHIEVNALDEKKKKSMASRIIVGVLLAVTGIPSIFFGGWVFFVFMSFFLGFAIYEFIHVTNKRYKWYVWVFTYILTISYVYWAFVKSNISAYLEDKSGFVFALENHFTEPGISWYAMATSLGVYFVFGLISKDFDIRDIAYLFSMSFLVGLGFQCMLFCRYHPVAMQPGAVGDHLFDWVTSAFLFFFIVIGAFGNDTMAYFVGVFFGKHKMSPRVSPNKSWEGFFGGWILGGLLTFGFACMVEAFGHPILPDFKVMGDGSRWWAVVIISFALPLVGVLGDLTLSLIKRYFGTKDYGKLLAAHGGVLDRADSLMFCAIFASILIVVFEKGVHFFA